MSTINVSNLIIALQQKIDTSAAETDLLYYSKAMQQLRTGHVFIVDNVTNLPNATLNLGYLYYVRNDELVYFADRFGWVPIYNTSPTAIFSWGGNGGGSLLGTGLSTPRCSPVQEICCATDWCFVSAGVFHTAAIKTSGQIWSWGSGGNGQIGDGLSSNTFFPTREITSSTDWCQVSAAYAHTLAVKTTGQLWAWGGNICGRLGDGTTTARNFPVREFCSATDWCQSSSGCYHSAAVKTSGQLWTWGYNGCGRLGDGTTVLRCSPVRERCSATDWCQVSASNASTAAVKTSGQIWAWAVNTCGRLGDGTTVSKCSPVREFCSATDWCGVSAGLIHTVAIKTTGQLWAWGGNICGRLGDGTTVSKCSPVREISSATDWCRVSGYCYSAAIKTSGQLWAWGSNICGRLGDGTTTDRCSPVREITSSTDWCRVSARSIHTTAIKQKSL